MSDSDDDFKPAPPPEDIGDMFGSDSDDGIPPPPPPSKGGDQGLADSDDEGKGVKKSITTNDSKSSKKSSKKDTEQDVDSDDDPFADSDDDDDADDADVTGRHKIDKRKSFGPDAEDSSDDSDFDNEYDEYESDDGGDGGEERQASSSSNVDRKKKRGRGGEEGDKDSKKAAASAAKKAKKAKKKYDKGDVARLFADKADRRDGGGDSDDDEEGDEYEKGVTEEALTADEIAANALVEARHKKNKEMLNTDASELAQRYEEQHRIERKRQKYMQDMADSSGGIGKGTVAQQALLPSIQDPSIWRVKCTNGNEFQLVRSILLRHIDHQMKGGRKSTLKSAFHSSSKGFVYIEAFSEVCAKAAIMGLRGLYVTSFTKVNIPEMTQVLNASVKKTPLRVGQWVRLRRGPLKGDLARVIELMEGGDRAFVMAIPRADYSSHTGTNKSTVKPPQKMFDVVEAQSVSGVEAERRQHPADKYGEYFDFWKNDYYKNGFWYKEVGVDSYLSGTDVKPRLEELQMFHVKHSADRDFQDSDDDEQEADEKAEDSGSMQKQLLKELAVQMREAEGEETKASQTNIFRLGDLVEVIGGELRGLIAQVSKISLTSSVLEVIPYQTNLLHSGKLTVEMALVIKHIYPGAHVKIISGRYIGSTGRVVSVSIMDGDHIAAILTDGVNSEVQVNISSLQISAEVSVGHGDLGGYELYDCVSLSENETAVVIHVGAEKLRVINHMNVVKDVYPQEITSKRNALSAKQTAFDSTQTNISPGDIVKVLTGHEYIGKSGTVRHIMRGNLWIHSNNHLKNSGVMVVRGRSCVLAGSNTASSSQARNNAVAAQSIAIATFAPSNRTGNKEAAIGKTVKIIRGGFKGFLGNVVEATPTHFTLELLARVRKIVIERVKCKEVGDKDGAFDKTAIGGVGATGTGDVVGPLADIATPFLTADTPMHMLGSETPMFEQGNATPYGNETPGRSDDIWKVNESDMERAMNPPVAAVTATPAFVMTCNQWEKLFIVRILDGYLSNRHGVLMDTMDAQRHFDVSLIEPSGQLGQTVKIPNTSLQLAEIMNQATLKVVHGLPGQKGTIGQCTYMNEEEVVITERSTHASQMFKRNHVVVIFLG